MSPEFKEYLACLSDVAFLGTLLAFDLNRYPPKLIKEQIEKDCIPSQVLTVLSTTKDRKPVEDRLLETMQAVKKANKAFDRLSKDEKYFFENL